MIEALLQYAFLQNAVAAVLLGSVSCGLVGSLLFVNRMSSLAGGISHTVFGGLGLALLVGMHPLLGASGAGVLAALALGLLTAAGRERADSAIAAVWSIGMSLGLVFVSLAPGYRGDLMGYLFGSVLAVTTTDLALTGLVGLAAVLFVFLQYRRLLAVSFDPEFSIARGMRTRLLFGVFMCLTGLTVVVLMRTVGLVMVIALLSIPPATARMFTHRLTRLMAWSCVLSAAAGLAGLAASWTLDLPAGPSIVLCSGAMFGLALLLRAVRSRLPAAARHGREPLRSVTTA